MPFYDVPVPMPVDMMMLFLMLKSKYMLNARQHHSNCPAVMTPSNARRI